jgi:PIN domain nuclease of toxin-antitoxin system
MIVLDTAAWLWWVSDPSRLTQKARRAIAAEEGRFGLIVSAISVWEVAVKVSIGKLVLDRDVRAWVALASTYAGIVVQPVEAQDALESTLLPGTVHKDPADRIIVALARRLNAPLVTSDAAIRAYKHVKIVW